MKTVAWLTGIGTMLAALTYMVVSLNRWEWNRAGGLVVDDVTALAQDVPGADDAQIFKMLRRGGRTAPET